MVKASIIIPAYNAMAFLEATLNSVLQQTFDDFEVIIVNDGSKDNILEWAGEIKDDRVRLISQENKGLSGARNTGILNTRGEYIAFLDADDLWEETKLEKQVKYLDSHPDVGLVSTKVTIIDETDRYIRDFKVPEKENISLSDLLSYNYVLCGSTPVVRRECFDKTGVFDISLSSAADWDMWIRIALHYKVASLLDYLVFYRKHSTNMSQDVGTMVSEIGRILQKSRLYVPRHLYPVLDRRYAVCNLEAAWAMMAEGEYKKAVWFSKQTFLTTPDIAFSWSFIRLYFFIFTKKITGKKRYFLYRKLYKLASIIVYLNKFNRP